MIAILGALFAVGAIGFWAMVAIETIILIALIDNEKPFWATFMMVGTLVFLHWIGSFSVVTLAVEHPWYVVEAVVSWFALGTGWSIAKWWLYVRGCREQYDENKRNFLDANNVQGNEIPDNLLTKWSKSSLSGEGGIKGVIPRVRDHKSKVMLWMCYWPWSMAWTLINDPVKRLFRQIYLQIQGLLQSISDRAFKDVESDFRAPPPPPPAPPAPNSGLDPDRGSAIGYRRGGIHEEM